ASSYCGEHVLRTGVDPRSASPRHISLLNHILEDLSVFQRVHGTPESLVLICLELIILDQALERLQHQLFTIADVVENLSPEEEESAIDPKVGALRSADVAHAAIRVYIREVERQRRANC